MDLGDVFSGKHVREENVVSYALHDHSDGMLLAVGLGSSDFWCWWGL